MNKRPAVRTNPPTAQDIFSLNGISCTHCWKYSRTLKFSSFWGNSDREDLHESAIESRLALPP
jgi:hypothetical protein